MLDRTPYHRALYRPHLLLGADRALVIVAAGTAMLVIATGMNGISVVVGVGLWLLSIAFLRSMAKSDPQMRQVYMRSRRYRGFYPPRSRPYRVDPGTAMTKGRM